MPRICPVSKFSMFCGCIGSFWWGNCGQSRVRRDDVCFLFFLPLKRGDAVVNSCGNEDLTICTDSRPPNVWDLPLNMYGYCMSFPLRCVLRKHREVIGIRYSRLLWKHSRSGLRSLDWECCIASKWRTKMLHCPIQSLWAPAHSFWLGLFWEMAQVPNMYFFGTVPSICQVGCCTPRSIPSKHGPFQCLSKMCFLDYCPYVSNFGRQEFPQHVFFLQMFLYAQA